MNGLLQRRSHMTGNALLPLENATRTFQHNTRVSISDGHIFEIQHTNVNYSAFLNISDISLNGNNESTKDNWLADDIWLSVEAGDVIDSIITPVSVTMSGTTTGTNFKFPLIQAGKDESIAVVPATGIGSIVQGVPFINHIVFDAHHDFYMLGTYHAYHSGLTYTIRWDIKIWLNGKRII